MNLITLKDYYYYYLFPYIKYFKDYDNSETNLNIYQRFKLFMNGFMSDKYYIYELFKNNPKDYMSDIERFRMRYINRKYQYLLKDKSISSSFLKNYLPVPECYAVVKKKNYYPVNLEFDIKDFESFFSLLKNKKLILKPVSGSGGKGIILLEYKNENKILYNQCEYKTKDEIRNIVESLHNYIIVEFIEQAEYAKQVFPSSSNTIRILTYKDDYMTSAEIFLARHRFGTIKSIPVDNISNGGISVVVNEKDGSLMHGFIFNASKGLIKIDRHPDTGTIFSNYKIANWSKIVEKILKAQVGLSYYFKILGWDIISTDENFYVVECNVAPDIAFAADYKIFNNKDFSEFLFRNKICKRR